MSSLKVSPQRSGRPAPPRAHQFVERFAVALETDGFPRIAGRIFALLMISDSEMSLDSIAETVGASKASVSVNTRFLETKGLIERISRTGDRRDYYQTIRNPFVHTMEQRIERWDRVRAVIGEGLKDGTLSQPARTRLREFDAGSQVCRDVLEAALVKLSARAKS
jgi:DNA-binding transcriptional regulator GbsR (MarR family)